MFIARLAKLRLKLTQEWQKMSLVRSLFTFETRLQRALGPDRGFRSANARPGGNGTSSQRGQGAPTAPTAGLDGAQASVSASYPWRVRQIIC